MSLIGGDRVLKVCDLCGGVDDHPRHAIAGAGGNVANVSSSPSEEVLNRVLDSAPAADRGRLLRDLQDTTTTEHHYDCGRDSGCELCRVIAEGAKGTGKAMLSHVQARKANFDDPGIVWADTE